MLVFSNVWPFFLGSSSGEEDQGILSGLFKQSSSKVSNLPSGMLWTHIVTIVLIDLKFDVCLKLLVMPLLEWAALLCDFIASQMRELVWLKSNL